MESLIDDKTKAIYCENISFNVPDIPVIAEIAHRRGFPLVVDDTFGACGFNAGPLELGADIFIKSATKVCSLQYVKSPRKRLAAMIHNGSGATGQSLGASFLTETTRLLTFNTVFESNDFRYGIDALVGHTFYEVLRQKSLTTKIRLEILRDLGACLAPQSVFIQGHKHSRSRHLSNALTLAKYLESHPKVAWVSYPGLLSHEDHEIAKRLLKGFGCVLSFGVKGGRGDIVVDNLKLHSHLANLMSTLIIQPASVTHGQLTEEERLAACVPQDMLRVSVGTEHIPILVLDYAQLVIITP